MNCFFCNRGMAQGVSLYRINEKGVKGVWACDTHRPAGSPHVAPEVREIVRLIEDNR